jgi:hypothetical protein
MSKFSTSFEPSGAERAKFAIACFAVLMAISGIIFDQPVLGILGVILLLITIAISLRRSADDWGT